MITDSELAPPTLSRALPGWATDAIRSGVMDWDGRDYRRPWSMALRVATSAYRRGWSASEFATEIAMRENGLWLQLITRPGRRLSKKSGYKAIWKAWETAVANANNVGMRTKAEIAADAVELAYMWVDRVTNGVDGLTEVEAAVMGYVISETERRGYLQVTCPCRAVADFAKTSNMSATRVLNRLADRGLLVKHSPGRRSEVPSKRKAAIYGLADPDALVHRNPG